MWKTQSKLFKLLKAPNEEATTMTVEMMMMAVVWYGKVLEWEGEKTISLKFFVLHAQLTRGLSLRHA